MEALQAAVQLAHPLETGELGLEQHVVVGRVNEIVGRAFQEFGQRERIVHDARQDDENEAPASQALHFTRAMATRHVGQRGAQQHDVRRAFSEQPQGFLARVRDDDRVAVHGEHAL
jgi:hypothetical protein